MNGLDLSEIPDNGSHFQAQCKTYTHSLRKTSAPAVRKENAIFTTLYAESLTTDWRAYKRREEEL
ncbi:hypothetical protein PJP10_31560, partial [Mycobacterium kansasii]